VIIFWPAHQRYRFRRLAGEPQYLEFAGFGLLIIAFFILIKTSKKRNSSN